MIEHEQGNREERGIKRHEIVFPSLISGASLVFSDADNGSLIQLKKLVKTKGFDAAPLFRLGMRLSLSLMFPGPKNGTRPFSRIEMSNWI